MFAFIANSLLLAQETQYISKWKKKFPSELTISTRSFILGGANKRKMLENTRMTAPGFINFHASHCNQRENPHGKTNSHSLKEILWRWVSCLCHLNIAGWNLTLEAKVSCNHCSLVLEYTCHNYATVQYENQFKKIYVFHTKSTRVSSNGTHGITSWELPLRTLFCLLVLHSFPFCSLPSCRLLVIQNCLPSLHCELAPLIFSLMLIYENKTFLTVFAVLLPYCSMLNIKRTLAILKLSFL